MASGGNGKSDPQAFFVPALGHRWECPVQMSKLRKMAFARTGERTFASARISDRGGKQTFFQARWRLFGGVFNRVSKHFMKKNYLIIEEYYLKFVCILQHFIQLCLEVPETKLGKSTCYLMCTSLCVHLDRQAS